MIEGNAHSMRWLIPIVRRSDGTIVNESRRFISSILERTNDQNFRQCAHLKEKCIFEVN